MAIKRILVPVDLSGATVKVCNAAAALAKAVGGRLIIEHVIPPPAPTYLYYYPFPADQLRDIRAETGKRAAHRLEALRRWFDRRCPGTKFMIHDGDAVKVILRTAKFQRPDYIVIGSHGHTAAYDLLVGSTTHGIMRKAPCPVVVVPIAPAKRR